MEAVESMESVSSKRKTSQMSAKKSSSKSYQLSSLYSKYFLLVPGPNEIGTEEIYLGCQAAARCLLCATTNLIQFTAGTTSNLRKHLKRKHPSALNEIDDEKAARRANLCPAKATSKLSKTVNHHQSGSNAYSRVKNQMPQLTETFSNQSPHSLLDAVTTFIVNTMQPVGVVNDPSFIYLLEVCSTSFNSAHTISVYNIVDRIINRYEMMIVETSEELAVTPYVCITADVWNSEKSVIVVTAHWLTTSLTRKSVALACVAVKGPVALEEVAQHLGNVLSKYELHKKVNGSLTINITTFPKPFNIIPKDEEESNEEMGAEEQEVATILPTDSLSNENDSVHLYFPNHYHCLSRSLVIVASIDIKATLDNILTYDLPGSALTKSLEMWKKLTVRKSEDKSAQKFIKLPFTKKWNSYFRAVNCIVILIKDSTPEQVCTELEMPALETEEIKFLHEFEQVLKPLVVAANHLNGENDILLAHVLPTVNGLKRKLINMCQLLEYCKDLAEIILESIERRFGNCYKDNSLIVASCSHPNFRMRWIQDEKSYALSVLEKVLTDYEQLDSQNQQSVYAAEMEEFYGLECVAQNKSELQRFLEDSRSDLECLDCYPTMKEIFRRFNTTIANRTPIDQLFASEVTLLSSFRPEEKNFEMQLLLRANNHN